MNDPAYRRATYDDILALPDTINGEIIDGVLHTQPHPAGPHAGVVMQLATRLAGSFDDASGGIGGWYFLFEPELHLGDDILVPDIAGWRVERLPVEARQSTFFTIAPDWACEVLSSRTVKRDREIKAPCYARHGIGHMWLVEPHAGLIEAYARRDDWVRLNTWSDAGARIPPFEAIALDLATIWASIGGPRRT